MDERDPRPRADVSRPPDEARALYLQYRGEKNVQGNKGWDAIVLEDFTTLRKAGLTDPRMEEVENTFGTSG